ncbi:MAG: TonB-dependent receptor [Bacteroidota bacterium]
MRVLFVILMLLVAICIFSAIAEAQRWDGGIEGALRSDAGPVPDAGVTVRGLTLQGVRGTTTDAAGRFSFPSLPVGTYVLEVAHAAYIPVRLEGIVVELGGTTSVGAITLKPLVYKVEPVSVQPAPSTIDPSTTVLRTRFTAQEERALPTDRGYRSIVSLAPGASASALGADPSFGGSTFEGNYFYIDGVDATEPGGAGGGTNLPNDFIESVEVRDGGFEAEDGRALGGIVNVVTPTGGDDLHGRLFGYYTDHRLVRRTANSLFEAPAGDFSAYDFGGSLGGPIVKQRLWWFAAYNPAFDRRQVSVPGLAAQNANVVSHRVAGKVTWHPTQSDRFTLIMAGDPSRSRVVGVPFGMVGPPDLALNEDAMVANARSGGVNLSLRGERQVSRSLLLQGTVARLHLVSDVVSETERARTEPFLADFETNTVSGGYGGENHNSSDRLAGRVASFLTLGKHLVKAGAEYTDNWFTNDIQYGAGMAHGGFLFRASDSSWTWYQGFQIGKVHVRSPALYARDSWTITPRLRANLGVRWDANYYEDWRGRTALRMTNALQPRVGLTYLLGPNASSKVVGYYGRVYEQLPLGSPGYYFARAEQLFIGYDHDPRVDPSGGDSTLLLSDPPGVGRVHGEYFDEWLLGYERALDRPRLRIGVHARYRSIGNVVEDAFSPAAGAFLLGNPGEGALAYLPRARQFYQSVELSVQRPVTRGLGFEASYVLSRTHGNYAGLMMGNAGTQFDFVETTVNGDGPLPVDRPHNFKLVGTYSAPFGVEFGAAFLWESGTPVSELGALAGLPYTVFLSPRGSNGRTPSLRDLSLRLSYMVPGASPRVREKLILDLFHVLGEHRAISLDERHFLAVDSSGNQTSENPNYLKPSLYQPPFSARLGAALEF